MIFPADEILMDAKFQINDVQYGKTVSQGVLSQFPAALFRLN